MEENNRAERRRRASEKENSHENLYYIRKWSVTEKQIEEAVEQTKSNDEEKLYNYLYNHGYIS